MARGVTKFYMSVASTIGCNQEIDDVHGHLEIIVA
jgi:hypothetical protein